MSSAFLPLDESYYKLARGLGFKKPEQMDNDALMRSLGLLTSQPDTTKPGVVESDFRSDADQARAIASVARNNGIPFYAGLLKTGIRGMAAPVGRSNHQSGRAVDINTRALDPEARGKLYQTVSDYGLKRPLPRSDSGHIEVDKGAMGPFPAPGLEQAIAQVGAGTQQGGASMDYRDDEDRPWSAPAVPNAVAPLRAAIEKNYGHMRDGSGSFANTIGPELDMIEALGRARMANAQGSKVDPLSFTRDPLSAIGAILSEVSVPVDYGFGSGRYGQAMAGNTLAAKHAGRMRGAEDEARKLGLNIGDDTLTSTGEAGIKFFGERRAKQVAAQQRAASILAMDSGPDGVAAAQAVLRGAGLAAEAAKLAPGSTASSATPSVTPSAPPVDQPSGVPGISLDGAAPAPASPTGPPQAPMQGQAPGIMEGGLPGYLGPADAKAQDLAQRAKIAGYMGDEAAVKALKDQIDANAKGTGLQQFRDEQGKLVAQEAFKREETARKRTDEMPAARASLNSSLTVPSEAIKLIDSLIEPTKDGGVDLNEGAKSNFGSYWNAYAPNKPGGAAATAWSTVERLKNLFSIQGIADFKAASGGIGAVTEAEWDLMASRFGRIDVSTDPAVVAEAMRDAKRLLEKERLSRVHAFEEAYGTKFDDAERTSTNAGETSRTSAQPDAGAHGAPVPAQAAQQQEMLTKLRGATPGSLFEHGGRKFLKRDDGGIDEVIQGMTGTYLRAPDGSYRPMR